MKLRLAPLKPLRSEQLEAIDPRSHAAVSASAGSGKTHVLTARVLTLLLHGTDPEAILCLTFTKAAAAEMANRISARLASWVRLKDSDLAADLHNLGEAAGPEMRRRARQLFARVLDAPGGLRIQTIHAFAQSLLAAFPAEAGISPGFQPIEGRAEQELVRQTLAQLLVEAEEGGPGADGLIADVQCLSRRLGEGGAVDYMRACAGHDSILAGLGPPQAIAAKVQRLVGLPEGSIDEFLARRCSDGNFDCATLRAVADVNRRWKGKEGTDHADRIERWLALPSEERARDLSELEAFLFTQAGERRKVRSGLSAIDPDYQAHCDTLADAVAELLAIQRGRDLADAMAAGLRAGQAFAAAYARAKRTAGVADFDDLIERTRALLAIDGMGEWVRFKLDRRIDHILVDEAQDTNAGQWEIVERLVEEFFSGQDEADGRTRTLFLVGDFKQAIFGFQGTDPKQFERARTHFRSLARKLAQTADEQDDLAGRPVAEFRDIAIASSFRSAQAILDVVDGIIFGSFPDGQFGYQAMGLPDRPPEHRAFHARRPGQVELWHPFAVEDEEDSDEGEESWVSLRDRRYAESLALAIQRLVEQAPVLPSTGRPLTPGDILVLVRSRGELASLLVARLFGRVPVAGVDRLHLHKPLAVQDLLAAVRFAVQPDDDLSLANLLVSPLLGWTQDQLGDVAIGRRGSLWAQLRRLSADRADCREAEGQLSELLAIADFETPARFLETILSGPLQGRAKLYGRLGPAARDPIEELINSAIDFEQREVPSLDRFLDWFARGDVDVQRDPGEAGNEVRVMTVHGAKGLESPVVIVADSTADPARLGRTPLTLDMPIDGLGEVPLLRPTRKERCEPFATLMAEQERRDLEEHWRLLYVALTRASDRLIVAGVKPKERKDGADPRPANCWHRQVEEAMVGLGAEELEEGPWGGLVHRRGSAAAQAPARGARSSLAAIAIPDWARRPAPPEARPPRPLAPSAIAEDVDVSPPPSPRMRIAARRGTLIHHLLERLPALDEAERRERALRWLEHGSGIADPAERAEIADTACRVIADPALAPLFGPGSIGEAPLAATLADGRVVAGTVDRLLVTSEAVFLVDFKTGSVPSDEAAVPASHRAQILAYRDALAIIFPDLPIKASLLYTGGPSLFHY